MLPSRGGGANPGTPHRGRRSSGAAFLRRDADDAFGASHPPGGPFRNPKCLSVARFGLIDRTAQYPLCNLLRSDIHEGASVKAGARRDRDFPNIHSASSANAERHETLCGCSHSRRRRRTAPCRSPGCNLSPALDLDSEASSAVALGLRAAPHPQERCPWSGPLDPAPLLAEASGGPGGSGPKPAMPSPQASGPQAPPGPPDACPPATRQPRRVNRPAPGPPPTWSRA